MYRSIFYTSLILMCMACSGSKNSSGGGGSQKMPASVQSLLKVNYCQDCTSRFRGYTIKDLTRGRYAVTKDQVVAKDNETGYFATVEWLSRNFGRYVLNTVKKETVCKSGFSGGPLSTGDPGFAYREIFSTTGVNQYFANANYLNASFKPGRTPKDIGYQGEYLKGWNAHTFRKLIPTDTYFQTKPEYFSYSKKKKTRLKKGQLCLTNQEVINISKNTIRKLLRETNHKGFISISQNDGKNFTCECGTCSAINEREGSKSATLIRFVNEIASSIKKEFPDVKLSTLAYFETLKPPRTIKPLPNVYVKLCTNDYVWSNPMADISKSGFANILDGWKRLTNNILIWDYTVHFQNYLLPLPNTHTVSKNLEYYNRKGVKGVFIQTMHDVSHTANVQMKSWVWAQKMWNINQNTQDLARQFNTMYFGVAAGSMNQYLMLLDQLDDRTYAAGDLKGYYNPNFINTSLSLFSKMEQQTRSNAVLHARVKEAKIPLLFTILKFNPANFSKTKYAQIQKEFLAIGPNTKYLTLGIKKPTIPDFLHKYEIKNFSQKTASVNQIVTEEPDFKIALTKEMTEINPSIVKDPLAENGFAIKVPGGNKKWLTQLFMDKLLTEGQSYTVSVRVRADKGAKNTNFGVVGIFSRVDRKYPLRKALEINGKNYQTINIGTIKMGPKHIVYFQPNLKSRVEDYFYIDSVTFRKL